MSERLNIILPCFNPPAGWDINLVKNIVMIQQMLPEIEIYPVLVNDGSVRGIDDNVVTIIRERLPALQYFKHDLNKGKGAALRTGLRNLPGDLFIFTDIDFPYTLGSFCSVVKKLGENNDVVLGYREKSYYEQVPKVRKVISRVFRWTLRNILRLEITDTQCGLKGFNEKGKAVFLDTTIDRFLFDMEFVMYCSREKNLQIGKVNVELNENVKFSRMNYKILLSESFNFFRVVFRRRK